MIRHVFFTLILLESVAAKAAVDIPCMPAEEKSVVVDGLLSDWRDIQGVTLDEAERVIVGREVWRGEKDLSFTIRCLRTDDNLYLSIDVIDNYLVRMKEAKPGEDHVELRFGDGSTVSRLAIYPSDMRGVPRKITGHPRMSKAVEVAEALQSHGYSIEIRLPLKAIPGFRERASSIPASVSVADCDSKVLGKTEKVISSADDQTTHQGLGRFTFGESVDMLGHFLKSMGLSPRDVVFDKTFEMGGDPGPERVILAGPYIAVIGEEYHYVKLNVKSPKDIIEFRVLDLTGDGIHSIVVRTVERAPSGSRQILHVFRMVGAGMKRPFAAEVAKEQGKNRIISRVSFVRHKKKTDIVIEAGKAEGWDASTFREEPADDVIPILLPWGEKRKAIYRFKGDEFEEVR
ncbi:MAG: hypothetical protein N2Z74_07940 [Syntrophales bacterium]|nr:hypothetical protein [Syntrophales bacterium]